MKQKTISRVLGSCFCIFACNTVNAQIPLPPNAQQLMEAQTFVQPMLTNLRQEPQPPLDMAQVQQRLEESDARIRELEELINKEKEASEKKEEEKKPEKKEEKKEEKKDKKWFEKYTLRGYTQLRFNQELFVNPPSAPAHYVGDRSVSEDQSFLIRRARLILAGDMNEHASLYFQPDFAVTTPGSSDQTHFVQIRDLYADLYFDTDREYRVRVGQSKVPYGFENLQSSSNRIPLDRADSLNSAVRNERDLGAFFYWTPKPAQDFFKEVTDKGLKGSGNYGVFGLGAYNGQGGSFLETNDNLHVVSRLTSVCSFSPKSLCGKVLLQNLRLKISVLIYILLICMSEHFSCGLIDLQKGACESIAQSSRDVCILSYAQLICFEFPDRH